MCKIIDFDAFLGVILEIKKEIAFKALREMVEHFENSSVVVNFSSAAVASALSHYPQVFSISREKKCYIRAKDFNSDFVKDEFDSMIPDEIKSQINNILSQKSDKHVGHEH